MTYSQINCLLALDVVDFGALIEGFISSIDMLCGLPKPSNPFWQICFTNFIVSRYDPLGMFH